MSIKGIVFDFNGTMFWDTEYQNDSWDMYLRQHGIVLSPEEKTEYIHGRNGKDTFEYIFKRELSREELEIRTEEKEEIYRNLCETEGMSLAPGLISLLDFLKHNGIRMAIATAAGKINVDFFIEKFNLLEYFERSLIIYNDGSVRGKPDPDLFNRAAAALDVPKGNVLVFEDSRAGVEAAKRSGVREIIIVDSTGTGLSMYGCKRITHFDQFDRSVLRP